MARPSAPIRQELLDLLGRSRRWLVLTGAGCSTEAGIPDYRDADGAWKRRQPVQYREFMDDELARKRYWARSMVGWSAFGRARPGATHRHLAALESSGHVHHLITQNVDGLHQASGVPDEQVIELHGNATYASCLECGARYELAPIREAFLEDETLPLCERCGGIVKTATISFGQAMPVDEMERAGAETAQCDLFIAIGSSLVVYPAAGFPALAKRAGAALVILNRDPTDLDPLADLVLNAEIGPTLSAVIGEALH